MVEVRDCDVVPGKTSRDARFEGRGIVREMSDDHLYNLRREMVWMVRALQGV